MAVSTMSFSGSGSSISSSKPRGMSTVSMTWMTPLLAMTSGAATRASLTLITPPQSLRIHRYWPCRVSVNWNQRRSPDSIWPATTW